MTTVYVVIEKGMVSEAYSTNANVEIVVVDRNTQDEEMLASIDREIIRIKQECAEIDIF